jgi:hypothetical protein
MAQTQQKASPAPSAKPNTPASSASPPPADRRLGLPFRLPRLLPPSSAAQNGTATPRKRSGWSRLLFGMLILMVGFYVLSTLLELIVSHLSRGAQDALAAPLAKGDVFILSGLNGLTLIWFALIAALYIALFRFNIIPRDPFNLRPQATARATTTTGTRGAPRSSPTSVNLNPQTRASRRQAAVAAEAAASNAKNGKNGKVSTKVAAASPAKVKAGQPGASKAQSAVRPKQEPAAVRSSAHDAEYERVKALQRQQRRREAKR